MYYRDTRMLPPFSLSSTLKLFSQQARPMNLHSAGFALGSCSHAAWSAQPDPWPIHPWFLQGRVWHRQIPPLDPLGGIWFQTHTSELRGANGWPKPSVPRGPQNTLISALLARTPAHTEPFNVRGKATRPPPRRGCVVGGETRKILLFWIKALEPKHQEDETLINDLWKPKPSKPDSHIHVQSLTLTGYYRDTRMPPPFSLSSTLKLFSQQALPMNLHSAGFALGSCSHAAWSAQPDPWPIHPWFLQGRVWHRQIPMHYFPRHYKNWTTRMNRQLQEPVVEKWGKSSETFTPMPWILWSKPRNRISPVRFRRDVLPVEWSLQCEQHHMDEVANLLQFSAVTSSSNQTHEASHIANEP